jgi:hypothetical protein
MSPWENVRLIKKEKLSVASVPMLISSNGAGGCYLANKQNKAVLISQTKETKFKCFDLPYLKMLQTTASRFLLK